MASELYPDEKDDGVAANTTEAADNDDGNEDVEEDVEKALAKELKQLAQPRQNRRFGT